MLRWRARYPEMPARQCNPLRTAWHIARRDTRGFAFAENVPTIDKSFSDEPDRSERLQSTSGASAPTGVRNHWYQDSFRDRPMISFMISVVPP
jgi:hypothetical protein